MANFNKILKQMQKLQQDLAVKQEEVKKEEVTGESAGGMVKVTMTCGFEIRSIDIESEIWEENDKEMILDLIAAAFNNATSKAQEKINEGLSGLTGGLNIPGLF